jgi:spermidine/putrescine transport system substrate-binding protein
VAAATQKEWITVMTKYVVLLLVLLAGCGQPANQLNIFIWSDYVDPSVIAEFEKRYDCQVNLDLYEDPESMIAKLSAGGDSIYDIVVPSDTTLPTLVARGMLARLNHENIPNLKHIATEFANPSFDPGNQFSAPYLWGYVGLYVRKLDDQPVDESWALIFDANRQMGSFMLMEDVRSCVGAALRYQGHSVNTIDLTQLSQARDLLIEAKKRSLGFEGSVGCKNRVLARGAVVGMTYNGDAVKGTRDDPETYFFVPREGSIIYVDVLSIPARAPHKQLAEAFINFVLEPEIGARVANFNRAGTPNQAALQLVDPEDRRNPGIYPPPDVMQRLEYTQDLGAKNRLYDELWTVIKSR